MSVHHRKVFIAGCAAILLSTAASGQQQDQQSPPPSDSEVIGNPQLREFQLPGRTTTPPADAQPAPVEIAPPAPKADLPAPTAPTPAVQPPARTNPTPSATAPAAPRGAAEGTTPDARPQPSAPAAQAPTPAPEPTISPAAPTTELPAQAQTEPTPASEPPAPSGQGIPWLLILLGIVAIAAAAFAFIKLRMGRAEGAYVYEPAPEAQATEPEQAPAKAVYPASQFPAPAAPSRPAPAATPVRSPAASPVTAAPAAPAPQPQAQGEAIVGVQVRPWLSLEFKPAQAAATLTEAVVQYELLLKNVGNTVARNIRVDARMFNAGADQDQEIAEFFRSPIDERRSARILAIPARSGARMRNAVALPKEQLREINVQGRRLFIPMVAINVVYEWADGKVGQTSMSYLVGREAETPSEKMGAFRLDLGPRVYRSVGQRPSNVAVLV